MATLKLPGLIDPHVHVRDLQQAHKETWATCTAAALAGGITTVLAMPNTQPPIVNAEALTAYEQAAQVRARCDYGLYLGANETNAETLPALAPRAAGLKLYLDQTFGDLKMADPAALVAHAERWPHDKPLLAHAEEGTVARALEAAHHANRPIHICHVSRKTEIEIIRAAKEKGWAVTCEVCPHHLFLNAGLQPAPGFAALAPATTWPDTMTEVRPVLNTPEDAAALWANLKFIDCFATDHAPHLPSEKEAKVTPGFPGLETALPLWLTALQLGKISLDDLLLRMCLNPRRIFALPEQPQTWVEVDPDHRWQPDPAKQFTRCGWTPFAGWSLTGKVTAVYLRGKKVFDGEKVLALPGSGKSVISY